MDDNATHIDEAEQPDQGHVPEPSAADAPETSSAELPDHDADLGTPTVRPAAKKRRRGSRGGKGRRKPAGAAGGANQAAGESDDDDGDELDDLIDDEAGDDAQTSDAQSSDVGGDASDGVELPERISEGRPSVAAAEQALVRRPQIGDTRPAALAAPSAPASATSPRQGAGKGGGKNGGQGGQRGGKAAAARPAAGAGSGGAGAGGASAAASAVASVDAEQQAANDGSESASSKRRRRGGRGKGAAGGAGVAAVEVDPEVLEKRRGRERNGRPIGRYLMAVQVRQGLTQVAVLEGRNLIEHYVSRPADDVSQIHGNIYLGKVQNVLPGMEAAFVDIGTPKNAVLYRGDVQYDAEDIVEKSANLRIEQMLKARQLIICQVTKNPIGAKGARLTQEVSLPGRFVVLIPNSNTYGISKRLPDDVRKRLRNILDRVKPAEHGLIVRTAAENATEHELRADMTRLLDQWNAIEAKAKKATTPSLLYREPELAVRVIREEFNAEYRGVVIDDQRLFDDVKDYVTAFNPELADRIEFHDPATQGLPLFEHHHIHEQLHKALDRKVWLPSGGSLIIEHTEALTVIDVNTGKNVGTTNLEETVFRNNLEAAEEVAKQLRLRDIGGIVVIDFIDMEIRENRKKVVEAFRNALARDKTRTQVFDISELGLVEMTRKRIGEGLLTNFADQCPNCSGRGVVIDTDRLV